MLNRVVVTGLGVVTPIGSGKDCFWDGLVNGRSGVVSLSRFDTEKFSVKIAGEVKDFRPEDWISEKDVNKTDLFTQYAIAASTMAVQDSGLDGYDELDKERAGVLVGSGIGGLQSIEDSAKILAEKGPRRISPFLIPMLISDMASGMISMKFGFQGPNMDITTACATGNNAIGEAFRMIQHGEADVMLSGGTEAAITPLGVSGFASMKALSRRNDAPQQASRPFDRDRDGFVMGEGAGVVVLENYDHARRRGATIYAELTGYGRTADAYHMTAPDPEGMGAQRAMRLAIKDAGLTPEQVEYVNAHGTSTPLNDVIETRAIKSVFGDHARKLKVSSTKSMVGHLLGAAGGVEFVACCLMLQNNTLAPTINLENPEAECDLDYVPNQAEPFTGSVCMSNGLGFGGHNAVLVVERLR